MTPKQSVSAFFDSFYARDWPRLATFFGDESVYYDVPVGPQNAAKGAESIVKRLRSGGIDGLAAFADEHLRTVAEGDTVITEHGEIWTWNSGETVTLPVVSVHVVQDGIIVLWKDYWNIPTLLASAPQAWSQEVATNDSSWRFDATGTY